MFVTQALRVLRARTIKLAIAGAVSAGLVVSGVASAQAAPTGGTGPGPRPTIVLVHGAWADGSSWSGVVARLQCDGYPVDVAPNPLRSLSADTAYLKDYLATITGPVILVGHSYGGAVITDAATGNPNVKALVYIDAYIPDAGQSLVTLSGPESALAAAGTDPTSVFRLVPYPGAPTGVVDTYLLSTVVLSAFAPDLPRTRAQLLAATQPPTSLLALVEPSGPPAWATIPSWDLVGTQDKIIPVAQQLAMAHHAGARITQINSSHVSLISHPDAVTKMIEAAAHAGR
jgi:pimeloyl-ACP methyl ester carboxylesterase